MTLLGGEKDSASMKNRNDVLTFSQSRNNETQKIREEEGGGPPKAQGGRKGNGSTERVERSTCVL